MNVACTRVRMRRLTIEQIVTQRIPIMPRIAYSTVVFTLLGLCASPAGAESLVAEGAKVQKLAGGFKFTEGAAVDAKGNVFFSDIPNNRTHVWSIEGKLSTFREDTGGGNGN